MSIKIRTQSADQEGCPVPIFFGQRVFKCGSPHFL